VLSLILPKTNMVAELRSQDQGREHLQVPGFPLLEGSESRANGPDPSERMAGQANDQLGMAASEGMWVADPLWPQRASIAHSV